MSIPITTHTHSVRDPRTREGLLTTSEVASYLNYHPVTVMKFIAKGALRPHSRIGRALFFSLAEIGRFADGHNRTRGRPPRFLQNPPKDKPAKTVATLTINIQGKDDVVMNMPNFRWSSLDRIVSHIIQTHGKRSFRISILGRDGTTYQITGKPSRAERGSSANPIKDVWIVG